MLPRLRALKPLNIYRINLLRTHLLPLRPAPTFVHRSYARYSRFDDEEGGNKGGDPNDPDEKDFRRKFELFRLYGTGALVVGGGTIWYVSHLEQVSETNRWRYMDTSESMRKLLEQQSYTQLMSEYGKYILPMNHKATQLVQAVAEKLISKNGLGHVVTRAISSNQDQKPDEWLVYVVDQDIQNAFVMPGRKIVVFSGMLHQVEDENQLAGILAHEVAHQMVGHVLEKVSLTRLLLFLDIALQFIIGTNTNIAGIALQAFVGLPNSRTQELEADLIGLRLMSKACFDPDAVVSFWRSFDKQDRNQPPQFLSTHPGHRQRAKAIEGWIPAIRSEYPCAELVDFSQAYRTQTVRDKPSASTMNAPEPARQPRPVPRGMPRQAPAPVPSASPPSVPNGSEWGRDDPWAQGSSGSDAGSGDDADWGTRDPWAEKNGGKSSSW